MTVLPCYGLISQKNSCHSSYLDYRCEQPQTLIHVLTFILLTEVVNCGIHSEQPAQTMMLILGGGGEVAPPPPDYVFFWVSRRPIGYLLCSCFRVQFWADNLSSKITDRTENASGIEILNKVMSIHQKLLLFACCAAYHIYQFLWIIQVFLGVYNDFSYILNKWLQYQLESGSPRWHGWNKEF